VPRLHAGVSFLTDEITVNRPNPFSFLEPVDAIGPHLRDLATALRGNARFLGLEEDEANGRASVRRLATFFRSREGSWEIKRLYISYQAIGQRSATGYRGYTFLYDPRRGGLQECPFPADPKLKSAGHVLSRLEAAGRADVLRYVPLRRLTLRGHWDPPDGPTIIVKVVESGATGRIARRLRAVERAAERASFGVAGLLIHDESGATVVQQCLPGQPLVAAITLQSLEATMRRLGALHGEVHELAVPDHVCGDADDPFPTVLDRLDWLGWVRPGRADFFRAVRATLEGRTPAGASDRRVFCHGDFRCTQILADDDRWAVIDFDEAGYADLCQDVGRFLAFLEYDLPLFQEAGGRESPDRRALLERAETAYLEGYASRARREPDPRALLWHRTCQEVLHLAQRVRRDLADEEEFGRGCTGLEALCHRLES